MNCPKCGEHVEEGFNFCEGCGFHLKRAELQKDAGNIEGKNHTEIIINDKLACVSDIGLKHKTNQDTGGVMITEKGHIIIVVADGVSSSKNAKGASQIAVETIIKELSQYDGSIDIGEAVKKSIMSAQETIIAMPCSEGESAETTVVAAVLIGSQLTVGWVGDSRAYVITNGIEEQITVDDSWVEDVVREGKMTREEALKDTKYAHCITQDLGMKDSPIEIHLVQKEIKESSLVLLCSDGVWNYLPNSGDITAQLKKCEAADSASMCRFLVNYAIEHGGRDNITAAIFSR